MKRTQLGIAGYMKAVEFLKKYYETNKGWPTGTTRAKLGEVIRHETELVLTQSQVAKAIGLSGLPRLPVFSEVKDGKNGARAQLVRVKRALIDLYEALGHPVPRYLKGDEE